MTIPAVIDRLAGILACPHCHTAMRLDDRSVACEAGHTFDVARQGYVNLLQPGKNVGTADTADMVAARDSFLTAGHFAPLSGAIRRATEDARAGQPVGWVVDVGAGTGTHLSTVLDACGEAHGLALDLSKHACRRAARAHPRMGAVVCDVWQRLPLQSDVANVVLCVFAPRNVSEIARVLSPGGIFIVATPTASHLRELVEPLGLLSIPAQKSETLHREIGNTLTLVDSMPVQFSAVLDHAQIVTLVQMGPSSRHITSSQLRACIAELPDLMDVSCSVSIDVYTKR